MESIFEQLQALIDDFTKDAYAFIEAQEKRESLEFHDPANDADKPLCIRE